MMERRCPQCGARVTARRKLCTQCGRSVTGRRRGRRRLSRPVGVLVAGLSLAWLAVIVPADQRSRVFSALPGGGVDPAVAANALLHCQTAAEARLDGSVLDFPRLTDSMVKRVSTGVFQVDSHVRVRGPGGSPQEQAFSCRLERDAGDAWSVSALELLD